MNAGGGGATTRSGKRRKAKAKKEHDPTRCVRCGTRLHQRYARNRWVYYCPECDCDMGPVPATS